MRASHAAVVERLVEDGVVDTRFAIRLWGSEHQLPPLCEKPGPDGSSGIGSGACVTEP